MTKNGNVDLLQCVLIRSISTKGVLPPSADEATFPRELGKGVRQAYWGYVGVPLEVHEAVQLDNGNVVVEISRIEIRVDGDGEDIKLNIGVEFTVIVHIPFSQPDLMEKKRLKQLNTVTRKIDMVNSPEALLGGTA